MAKSDESGEGASFPAPEETFRLAGHGEAEAELLAALRSGRMHHAWMLTGPRGIGKATLAFRFARFLLRHGHDEKAVAAARSLDVPPDDRTARQIAAGAAQDLLVLSRRIDEKTGKLKTVIDVDQVRRVQDLFGFAAGGLGWRVAIIDAVDDLNRNAANALLKSLEEPPKRAVLLLVTHSPGRTLPTIRSRCRKLALKPLRPEIIRSEAARHSAALGLAALSAADEDLIVRLAGGSLGRALELRVSGGLAQYRALERTLKPWPNISEGAVQEFLSAALPRRQEGAFESLAERILDIVRGAALAGASGQGGEGARAFAHLAAGAPPHVWADLAANLDDLFVKGRGLNLDERAVITEALRRIAAAGSAGRHAA